MDMEQAYTPTYTSWDTLPSKTIELQALVKKAIALRPTLGLDKGLRDCATDLAKVDDATIAWAHEILDVVMREACDILKATKYDERHCPQELKKALTDYKLHGIICRYHVRYLQRAVAYRRAKKPYFHLPEHPTFLFYSSDMIASDRRLLAERVLKQQQLLKDRKDPRVSGNDLIFTDEMPTDALKAQLEPMHHWLIESGETLAPLEWEYFPHLVATLMKKRIQLNQTMQTYPDQLRKDRIPLPEATVENCTSTLTAATIEPAESECQICMAAFSTEDSAVKTKCGHIIGKCCLQTWMKDHNSCPHCRSPLMEVVDMLPPALKPYYGKIVALLDTTKGLDDQIDRYLLGGIKEFNDPEFGELLFSLDRLSKDLDDAILDMCTKAKKITPLKAKAQKAAVRLLAKVVRSVPESWVMRMFESMERILAV